MRAFHGDPAIKAKYLDRVRMHAAADEIIKDKYWENGKGCAVGCTIHSSVHEKYQDLLGIPVSLALLEDLIFENLPNAEAKLFPSQFLEAIPVGADLKTTSFRFSAFLLNENMDRVRGLAGISIDRQCLTVIEAAIESNEWSAEVWCRYRDELLRLLREESFC